MIIHNARFYLDGSFDNPVRALRVENGLITELLSSLPARLNPDDIDLGGEYAYPGFIDTHTHSFSGGLYSAGVDLQNCPDLNELLHLISEALASLAPGALLFAWNFDESSIHERRFPTQQELDSMSPHHYTLLRRIDGHSCMMSSNARALITDIASQDTILKGADNDRATHWFHSSCDDAAIMKAYHSAAQVAMKGGFCTVHTMIGDAEQSIDHYHLLRDRADELPIEYILYPQSFNVKAALEAGAKRIGGCILADGSIGSHTAALSSNYEDSASRGQLYHDDRFWREFITEAHKQGLQVCVHCIGDAAIRQINSIYHECNQLHPADLRHQLIHCELTPDDLMDQIKTSGAVPVMQPAFDLLWGGDTGFYALRLGSARAKLMNRFAGFEARGVRVTGSSDWYVTPMNAAMSIYACIHHHNPAERLTPQQAIGIYTQNAAWLSHDEQRLGKLEQGFQADLSVLDTDLTAPFHHRDVQVKYIVKEGKQVYANTSHSS